MCVFMFSNLQYQKMNAKRYVLSKTPRLYFISLQSEHDLLYRCLSSLSSRWNNLDFRPGVIKMLSKCWWLSDQNLYKIWCWRIEGSSCWNCSVRPGQHYALNYHTKTVNGGFLCNSWGWHEIKMKYIYTTQLSDCTRYLCTFSDSRYFLCILTLLLESM